MNILAQKSLYIPQIRILKREILGLKGIIFQVCNSSRQGDLFNLHQSVGPPGIWMTRPVFPSLWLWILLASQKPLPTSEVKNAVSVFIGFAFLNTHKKFCTCSTVIAGRLYLSRTARSRLSSSLGSYLWLVCKVIMRWTLLILPILKILNTSPFSMSFNFFSSFIEK